VPTNSEICRRSQAAQRRRGGRALFLAAVLASAGCGEPSPGELKNRQELEALLTAVSLKNRAELENDARRIKDRYVAGELSGNRHEELQAIITKARAGDWAAAEKQAYAFREQNPYFK
jgi:hypothetical protein